MAQTKSTVEILQAAFDRHQAPESLTAAASDGRLQFVQAFLDRGSNIEEKSVGFSSPLHAAANTGQRETVEFLLKRGARPEIKKGELNGPLSAACGHWDIFRIVLAATTDVSEERTALVLSAAAGRMDAVKELMTRGAAKFGRYAVASAAQAGQYEVVKFLVDSGVEWKEFTALRIPEGARDAGFTELFKYLTDAPFNEAVAIDAGRLAREKKEATREAQLKARAVKQSPPDAAERVTLLDDLRTRVQAGELTADINKPVIRDPFGEIPPIAAAAAIGDPSLVEAILHAGAKPAPKLKGGSTVKEMMRGPERQVIAALLDAAAAKPTVAQKKPKTAARR